MQENIEKISKLANFPIVLFASVMGIGGLSLAFKKASVAFNHQDFLAWSAFGFAILALIVFALLFVCYGAKILYHFKAFKADLTHQVKINFLSSVPISMLIITAFWSDFISKESGFWWVILESFYVASALQLILSLYVMSFWFRESMKSSLLSPAWFIPVVGNLIVPLSGAFINAPKDMLLFFFCIGCFFWIILSAMIMQRLIFEQSLETKFIPTLFIFIAPPSIFVLDFHSLFQTHSILSLMVYFIALFFVLLLIFLSKIFSKLSFAPSWWAFTFPLCAFSIASFDLFITYKFKYFYGFLGVLALILALFAVFFISYKTLKAVANGNIFKEH
ncbi:SLAC1 anion channel family protein [Campylobacter upsaliensis]|uniref:SLAC1 anion channel family protein n=1 Tax=Campylobacter upsaliensis TaxID=28080 RepID=UPI002B3FC832|nr:SLAC1 anion channel family protein [Campylobacter upsaliensis]MEB2799153.1 SLAC1 anion channel family protein [Campylobacter upsaliensis]MEB2835059.1 SLAC1 anion channel family protein [Campylobacter upsaliensis]